MHSSKPEVALFPNLGRMFTTEHTEASKPWKEFFQGLEKLVRLEIGLTAKRNFDGITG